MRRTVGLYIAGVLVCLLLVFGGATLLRSAGEQRFVIAGASGVEVYPLKRGLWTVTYRFTANNGSWFDLLDRRMRANGWIPPDFTGSPAQYTIYSYVNKYWFGVIWEEVNLGGTPEHAEITVHRWLRIPWLFSAPVDI